MTQQAQTPYYLAPEILAYRNYDLKCDVWSVGIIVYILLHGIHPFMGNDLNELAENIQG